MTKAAIIKHKSGEQYKIAGRSLVILRSKLPQMTKPRELKWSEEGARQEVR